jgi:hypothetical protein
LDNARHWSPEAGDSIEGVVWRTPCPKLLHGRSLILSEGSRLVLVDASDKEGHTVLARELVRLEVQTGNRVCINYDGWREGARRYRLYRVKVLG